MCLPKQWRNIVLVVSLTLFGETVLGQIEIRGTVYDQSMVGELQGVSVISTSGTGTVSDSLGHYSIILSPKDSLYFSYLGRRTQKVPVGDIPSTLHYDVGLDVEIETLPPVLVAPNGYRLDSLENREEFKQIFDYEGKGALDHMKTGSGRGMGVGLNLDFFSGAAVNKSRLSTQRYFEEDERQRYVDHRFSKNIVRKITGLQPPALDAFMHDYRPRYDFTKSCTTDFEFYQYILDASKSFAEVWKEEHPDHPIQHESPIELGGTDKDSTDNESVGRGSIQ
jgi:hypothetical protein